jgi:hypothetical protein
MPSEPCTITNSRKSSKVKFLLPVSDLGSDLQSISPGNSTHVLGVLDITVLEGVRIGVGQCETRLGEVGPPDGEIVRDVVLCEVTLFLQ